MSVQTSPCNWPVDYGSCPDGLPEPLASMPASGVETYEKMATDYLWNWTGKSLGVCQETIYPCRQNCTEGISSFNGRGPRSSASPWGPVLVGGRWFNIGCGQCGDVCGCDGYAALKIPGPVDSVTEIKEDGVILDPSAYRVWNNALLERTDGKAWSPCGLEITYDQGVVVPPGGQVAAGVLTVELAKAACGDKTCGLPQRVQTITRQGVTVAMLDAFDDVDQGHTGIWIIDSWVASMTKTPPAARVLSPDIAQFNPRRKTWP